MNSLGIMLIISYLFISVWCSLHYISGDEDDGHVTVVVKSCNNLTAELISALFNCNGDESEKVDYYNC